MSVFVGASVQGDRVDKNQLDPDLKDVFLGSEAIAAGLVSKRDLQGPRFRRLFQNVYVRAETEVTHELRCRGATLRVPADAVLTGRSAATVMGLELAQPYDPVEFVVPEDSRFGPVAGMRIRRSKIDQDESTHWAGSRIALPLRIALDLIFRHSPRVRGHVRRLRMAVPDLDAFFRAFKVKLSMLEAELNRRRNWGVRLGREAARLVDTRAESLPESELRVVLHHGGLRPCPQVEVHAEGQFIGRLDLALEDEPVGIEYDGRWHNTPAQQEHDRMRRNRLLKAGWRIVVVTAEELATDYQGILDRVHAARRGRTG